MLRNLLYSLFLHSIVLALIYFNAQSLYHFNLKTLYEKNRNPVKINLIDINEFNEKQPKQEPTIEEEKITPPKPPEPKKENIISTEKITESIKESQTKKEEIINNYEYIKKPENPPLEEKIIQEPKIEPEQKPEVAQEKTKIDNTLDNIINETINFNEANQDEQIYADEIEPVEIEPVVVEPAEIGTGENSTINLSVREKVNIQRQIHSCYKMAILKSGVDSIVKVILQISVEKDGNIDMKEVVVLNENEYKHKSIEERVNFESAIENAKNALVFCSPLRNLPADKYNIWKEMSLEFDSNEVEVKE